MVSLVDVPGVQEAVEPANLDAKVIHELMADGKAFALPTRSRWCTAATPPRSASG
ncbi:hypothetical protein CLV70_116134 [Pseudosporangium ferrugineum]|uniref:Uncharacterized protein n=2 Tax=Pseudosporangium ferrugineum TaxID=439699 RepID=A0A2T0RNV4_9ACTN|nr:hypothetical protein CLV70_116134 [Pseudosporangium ferrugineum]